MRVRWRAGHAPGKIFPRFDVAPRIGVNNSHYSVWPLEQGGFFDFEVGGHDGAYKGRVHVTVPFVGQNKGNLIATVIQCACACLVPGLEEGLMFGGKAL